MNGGEVFAGQYGADCLESPRERMSMHGCDCRLEGYRESYDITG